MYKDVVEYIVKTLVDNPDQVEVRESEENGAVVLELRVDSADMGRVIGRGGRVVNAIRALVDAIASKQEQQVTLEVV